jgi:hypothetical protein
MVRTAVIAALAGGVGTAAAETPYVYGRTGHGPANAVTVEWESAVGTRESRPLGARGFEQGLRVRYRPTTWLAAEAFGGVVLDAGRSDAEGAVEVTAGVLDQRTAGVDVSLGGGFLRDDRGVSVPRARVDVGRAFGRLHLDVRALGEVPLAEGRDELDVDVGAAASYGLAPWARLGVESLVADAEGVWERDEAEGGARLVAGPTAWFAAGAGFDLRLNVAAVVPVSRGAPNAPPTDAGVLARLVVGRTF